MLEKRRGLDRMIKASFRFDGIRKIRRSKSIHSILKFIKGGDSNEEKSDIHKTRSLHQWGQSGQQRTETRMDRSFIDVCV